jgi:hypothetical protein
MSRVSISTGAGPGSSVSLAPETIRIRDALIEKFMGEPVDAMNQFMSQALQRETDEFRRLGILAARIYILRHRIANVQEFNRNPTLTAVPEITTASLNAGLPGFDETATADSGDSNNQPNIVWTKIQMREAGEVNGVRFLAGTIIDAKQEDAEKLVRSGRAVYIDEDGNEIATGNNDITVGDTSMAESEAVSEQEDAIPAASSSPVSADSAMNPNDDIDDASDSAANGIDDNAANNPDDAKTPSS